MTTQTTSEAEARIIPGSGIGNPNGPGPGDIIVVHDLWKTYDMGSEQQVQSKRPVDRGHDRRGRLADQLADPVDRDRADLFGLGL